MAQEFLEQKNQFKDNGSLTYLINIQLLNFQKLIKFPKYPISQFKRHKKDSKLGIRTSLIRQVVSEILLILIESIIALKNDNT